MELFCNKCVNIYSFLPSFLPPSLPSFLPSFLSALQPWVSLGLLNNQSPFLSIFHPLHPLLYLHHFQVCYHIIHPSQKRSSFPSSYKVFLPSSFLASLPLPFSLYVPTICSLIFYKILNTLSIYGSIQFFIISNSPLIPLLDWPIVC